MTARRRAGLAAAAVALAGAIVAVLAAARGPVPRDQALSCAGSRRATCGELSVGSRYVSGMFAEGAIITLNLVAAHASIGLSRLGADTATIRAFVPAGRFTLRSAVYPCDGNCSHLDAPLPCAASLQVRARELTRATVVVEGGRRCRITLT